MPTIPTSDDRSERADLIERHPALVSDLWDLGTTGVFEGPNPDGSNRPTLVAGFDSRATAEEAVQLARRHGVDGSVDPVDTNWHTDEETEITIKTLGGSVSFPVVAGPSFGHGSHPTTVLTLDLMSGVVERTKRFGRLLDLGTGSGVLSIAASFMGAESITAIDVDPEAVEVAKANFAANEVDAHCSTTSINELARRGARYDVVVANVLVTTHEEVAAMVIQTLAPNGCLIVSGFLGHQQPRVQRAYREHRPSLQERDSLVTGDWGATVLAEAV